MKKYCIILVFYILSLVPSLYWGQAYSQNPDLPSERCTIVLKNDKTIKDARLWEIYPSRVEYEKEGSLHDLLIDEIERIETDNEIITFEPDGKLFKQPYDLIILHPGSTLMQIKEGDTIKCRITKIAGVYIYYSYQQHGEEKKTSIELARVKKYIWNGVEKMPGEEEYPEAKTTIDEQNTDYNKSNTVDSERPQYVGRPPIKAAIKNKKVASADSSWTFRRFHIYFGKGGHIPPAEDLFNKAFTGSPYMGTLRDNNGSIYALGGNPQLIFREDVYLGLEYNLNSQITVGTWFRPFSSYFNGFNGEYDVAYHSVTERISGVRYCFNGSYALLHTTKPFRIEVNGGGSFILFSGNVNTNVSFYDSSAASVNPPNSNSQLVDEISRRDRFSGVAMEIYGIANIYFGKGFSVFIKPYIGYDEGFSVSAKTFSSYNQIADIPHRTVNFTGFGMLGGIAIHFWKGNHNKPHKTNSR